MFSRLYHPFILRGGNQRSCSCSCIRNNKFFYITHLYSGSQERDHAIVDRLVKYSVGKKMASDSSQAKEDVLPGTSAKLNTKHNVERSRCLFCRIVDGNEPQSDGKIVLENDELAVFPDIRPASRHHLLVVTKEHIKDAKALTASHEELVDRMIEVGKQALSLQVDVAKASSPDGLSGQIDVNSMNTLFGFHWPPFHTIAHLHLHVIAPSNEMGFLAKLMFRPNSYWFVDPKWVKDRLSKSKPKTEEDTAQ